ncbi:hypothetical protein ACYUMT_04760 [Latilactobacillus sakei]
MVDWNTIGKKAFDLSKDVAKKSIDKGITSHNDRKAERQIEQAENLERETRKLKKPIKMVFNIQADSNGKLKARDSAVNVQQIYSGEIEFLTGTYKGVSYRLEDVEIETSTKSRGLTGAIGGAAIAGGIGAVIAGTSSKNTINVTLLMVDITTNIPRTIVVKAKRDLANQLKVMVPPNM